MNITEIRQQYPQYDSISDGDLAYRLWNKSYKDSLPMGQFADQIGLSQDSFGEMVGMAKQSGYSPTSETRAAGERIPSGGKGSDIARAAFQGGTFGYGDEIVGQMAGFGSRFTGGNMSPEEVAQSVTQTERDRLGQFRQESPKTAMASEIGGAVATGMMIPAPSILAGANPIARGALTAGASGFAYGTGTGEGSASDRVRNGVEVAIPSALFGAGGQALFQVAGKAIPAVARAFKRAAERPSLETLRNAKQVAYEAVDDSGAVFGRLQTANLSSRAASVIDDLDYVPEVDTQVKAAMSILEKNAGKELTIGRVDRIRQGLWARHSSAGPREQTMIGEMIDVIDEMVESLPVTDDLMGIAREANSKFKKAEMIDQVMRKAQFQTSSTGSGGNILNKYKQAVTAILTNPKKAKWFNDIEIEQMEAFVSGSMTENSLRLIGKLSPNGNGLMTALNIGAVAADPMMAAVSATAAASKALSDRSGHRAMQGLMNTVSGVPLRPPTQVPYLQGASQAIGSIQGNK